MAELYVRATLDTTGLDRGIARANMKVGQLAKNIEKKGMNLEQMLSQQISRAALRLAAYGSIFATGAFIKQIVTVRGEFQQLQIAFETMLDSKEKANRIMSESIDLAQKTPFTLMDVTSNAKQLMAMGVSFEKVMGTIKNLGDVAAGVSVPLSRIAINYGQVLTLGRLQMREIRDFAMAGVPLIGELSKNLGKSTSEITKMVSAGKIGFKDVEEAFRTMSSEGGKFYNLMEKQNKSVTGQISNLVDKWQVMMNSIGKSNEGVIYGGIKGAGKLLDNYDSILKSIVSLIAVYGTYKAALITITALQKASVMAGNIKAWIQLAASIRNAKDAQIAFNLATKANPWVLLATVIASAAAAIWIFSDNTDEAVENAKELNKQVSDEKAKVLLLVQAIDNQNLSMSERNKNLNTLKELSPSILSGINLENIATLKSRDAIDAYIESLRTEIKLQQLKKQLSESIVREEDAKKYNQPISTVKRIGISLGVYKFSDTQKESAEIVKQEKALQDELLKAIKDTSKTESIDTQTTLSTAEQLKNTLLEIKTINGIINDIRSSKIKVADPAKELADQEKQLDEAEKKRDLLLGIDKKRIAEENRLESKQDRLKEQRNKNELFSATVLQGKLLKVEEETTNQKLSIAANEYQKNLAQVEKNKLDTLQDLRKNDQVWSLEDEATYQQGLKASEAVFLADKKEINRQAAEEIDKIWQDVSDYRLTGYKKEKAALDKKFNEEEIQLRKLYSDEKQLIIALAVLFGTYKQKDNDIDVKYAIQGYDLRMELEQKKNESSITGLNREKKIEEANFNTYVSWTEKKIEEGKKSTDQQVRNDILVMEATLANDKIVWQERQKDINKFSRNIDTLGKILGDALSNSSDEFVQKIGEAVGSITSSIGQIQSSSTNFGKVSGIVSLAITVGNYLKEIRLWNDNKAINDQKEITSDVATRLGFEQEINKTLLERNDITEGNIFNIEDYSKTLSDASAILLNQNELLNNTLSELFNNAIFSSEGSAKRLLFGTKTGTYEFSLSDILGNISPDVDEEDILKWLGVGSGLTELDLTKSIFKKIASGDWLSAVGELLDPFHIFGGPADQKARLDSFNNLSDAVNEALTSMGKTVSDFTSMSTQDMLDFFSLMESSGYITDEATKKLLNIAQEQLQEIQDTVDTMKETFSSIVDDLGSSLSDSLVDAFANGDLYSAIEDFHKSVGDVISDLVSQMVFAATMKPFFDNAQKAFMASYGLDEDGNALDSNDSRIDYSLVDDLTNLFNGVSSGMSDYEAALKAANDMLISMGYSGITGSSSDTSSGLSGQISSQLTEETGTELVGLYRRNADDTRIIRDYTKIGITHLSKIEINTENTVNRLDLAITELQAINRNTRQPYTNTL